MYIKAALAARGEAGKTQSRGRTLLLMSRFIFFVQSASTPIHQMPMNMHPSHTSEVLRKRTSIQQLP